VPRKVRHGDKGPGLAPGKDVGCFDTFEPCVDRNERRAGVEDPEQGDDPLDAVERPDRHPVTAPDPAGSECGGELLSGLQ